VCANRCLQAIGERVFEHHDIKIRATISAGIASRRADMAQAADLLKEADNALYAAKHAGRNTVRIARVDSQVDVQILPAA